MTTEIAARPARREITQVVDAVPILDTARFEHMQRIANIMANSSMIPKTLCTEKVGNNDQPLPFEQVLSNCFLVVNQAARWGMDPFSVISCCSVVHGRLAYEGKLVAAVLEAKLGISLIYKWNDKTGDAYGIVVTGTLPDGRVESVDGTVGQWKTTGAGSPWGKQPKLQLAYRGAREWARLYAPGVMLGVYSDDELADLADDARARRAQPVAPSNTLLSRLAAAPKGDAGFDREHVERETAGSGLRERESIDQTTGEVTDSKPDVSANEGGQNEVANSKSEGKESTSDPDTSTGNRSAAEQEVGKAGGKPATESNTEVQREAGANEPADSPKGDEPKASDQGSATADSGTSDAGGGSSSQPDLLSTATSPAAGSKGEPESHGQPGAAGGASDAAPSAAERLRSYSKALLSVNDGGPAKLAKQAEAWTKKWGTFDGDAEGMRKQIYAAHTERLTGGADIEATKAKVEGIIGK